MCVCEDLGSLGGRPMQALAVPRPPRPGGYFMAERQAGGCILAWTPLLQGELTPAASPEPQLPC